MKLTYFWQGCVVATVLLCLGYVPGQATHAQTSEQPNFLFILIDDLGWTDTTIQIDPDVPESKTDFYETPTLEQLATEGMVFTNAYSAAPACSPTRASIQTGKSPAQLQMTDITEGRDTSDSRFSLFYQGHPLTAPLPLGKLPTEQVTIPEVLKASYPDYLAAHSHKWHLHTVANQLPTDISSQGYDYYKYGGGLPDDVDPAKVYTTTDRIIEFLEDRADDGQPFYAQASYLAVHLPLHYREETLAKYEAKTPGQRHDNVGYAAYIEEMDTAVGILLDALDNLSLDDNTYVILFSDNGGTLLQDTTVNTPLYAGKGTLWEGGVRVPMIVKGPGITAGTISDVPVSSYDFLPTIADLAGVTTPLPDGVEGTSIVPILENDGLLPDGMDSLSRAYGPNGELFFHYPHYTGTGVPSSAIRDGDYKLVRLYGEHGGPDQVFLFDLSQSLTESNDPNSPLNLADDMPGKAAELVAKLDAWLDAVDASLPYDVAAPIQLRWDADNPGGDNSMWRSTIDVDEYNRENWHRDGYLSEPVLTLTSGQPFGLSSKVFYFDGSDVMSHTFFRVSDPKAPDEFDADHSMSVEMWVRMDVLDQEQVLFESGDGSSGLSLTLGDADNDGTFNEIRFRVLGLDGQALTVTTDIDALVDPTSEFIQLAAVFSDDPADRYVEIYLNGMLQARVNGVLGMDEIDWDGFDDAGLGNIAGSGLGANGGSGDLPFAGGGFVGELSLLNYYNYALDTDDLLTSYHAIVGSVLGDVDGDGFVGIDDLDILLTHWNTSAPTIAAIDLDGDNFVGIDDLDILLTHWNTKPLVHPSVDMNGDGFVGIDDLDILLACWNKSSDSNPAADLNLDGYIGIDDLDILLSLWNSGTSINLIADLNGDGFVGIDDLDIIFANWNASAASNPIADINGDGFIGIDDLDIVLKYWNTGTPPGGDQTSIPEPTSLALLGLGGVVLFRRH